MHLRRLLATAIFTTLSAFAADSAKPAKGAPTKADYPLTGCLVTDEKFDSKSKPVEYIHKQAGKPDRVILLCCEDCVKDFQQEPAKYLKKLDDAVAAKAKAARKS